MRWIFLNRFRNSICGIIIVRMELKRDSISESIIYHSSFLLSHFELKAKKANLSFISPQIMSRGGRSKIWNFLFKFIQKNSNIL